MKKAVPGFGIAILSLFLPYAVPNMPTWLAWSGVTFGVLIMLWGFLEKPLGQKKVSILLVLLVIIVISGGAGIIAYETKPNKIDQEIKKGSLEYKKKLIKQWRDGIERMKDDSGFGDEVWYSSLRPYMKKEVRQMLENERALITSGGRGPFPRKEYLLDEVARIEKEWGLTGYPGEINPQNK